MRIDLGCHGGVCGLWLVRFHNITSICCARQKYFDQKLRRIYTSFLPECVEPGTISTQAIVVTFVTGGSSQGQWRWEGRGQTFLSAELRPERDPREGGNRTGTLHLLFASAKKIGILQVPREHGHSCLCLGWSLCFMVSKCPSPWIKMYLWHIAPKVPWVFHRGHSRGHPRLQVAKEHSKNAIAR